MNEGKENTSLVIQIKSVSEVSELEGIKDLQRQNLKDNLIEEEADAEGFVTAVYSLEFLKAMHEKCPSIIAVENGRVIGYALVTLKTVGQQHPLLNDLFRVIDSTGYMGRNLSDSKYVVVGQLCVAKGYRGSGLVQKMYQAFRDNLHEQFNYCITDVATSNPRSLRAHQKTGFKVINTLTYGGTAWSIVLWDWK